jgi:exopolyphosphatase/guanosine-5'-triphosphate,3'-diphosphate pyrophosphatase
LFDQAADAWGLKPPLAAESLRWAARLHEVGLAIAHAQYHKHGGYLVENADMAGFSRHEQALVARLVRTHRRKILMDNFTNLPAPWPQLLPRVAVLLRLAVLLNRSRTPTQVPELKLELSGSDITLRFPEGWLDQHPLTRADLEVEVEYLSAIDLRLRFS